MLALWIGFQFVMFTLAGEDQISWAAHIGGIIAGAVLLVVLKRSEVPLLDRHIVTPQAAVVAPARADATRSRGPWDC